MELSEVMDTIVELRKIINKEMESVPYGLRPSVSIAKAQAASQLDGLIEDVKSKTIPFSLVGLIATGDEQSIDSVAKFLTDNGGIVIDVAALYKQIASLVEPSYSIERIFCTTQYHLLVQGITVVATDLGYLEIEAPKFQEILCKTPTDTLNHIRNTLRDCGAGDQANKDLLTKQIIDAIIAGKIVSKQIPVLVMGVSSVEERAALSSLFGRITEFEFPPDFTPDVKNVTALFRVKKQQVQENEDNA